MESSGLKRCGSMGSIISAMSTTSMGSSAGTRGLHEKLMEVKTLHSIASDSLNKLLELINGPSTSMTSSKTQDTMRKELVSFKTTAGGVVDSLDDFIDLVAKREEMWKRRLAKSSDKRKRLEAMYRKATAAFERATPMDGPDMVEGPNSLMTDDQWFDAIEDAVDAAYSEAPLALPLKDTTPANKKKKISPEHKNWLLLADSQVKNSLNAFKDGAKPWELVNKDGDIVVSRRDEDLPDGKSTEYIKTEVTFPGISAKEVCTYYNALKYRKEWEAVVERCNQVEVIDDLTGIAYAVYKRTWPAQQRELLNICHARNLSDEANPQRDDTWIAITLSIPHPSLPEEQSSNVRMNNKSAIKCVTELAPDFNPDKPDRSKIKAVCLYYCEVNPGGWAPKAVVKAVAIKEFPKVLRGVRHAHAHAHASASLPWLSFAASGFWLLLVFVFAVQRAPPTLALQSFVVDTITSFSR